MMDFKDTRKHIKRIIREMIGRSEIPSVNSVMTEIVRQRRAAGVDGSPSTTTVHSEIKDYFENEFWPVFKTYKGLSEVPEGLSRAHEIFQDGFSRIVLSCVELANLQYKEERTQFERDFVNKCNELEAAKNQLRDAQKLYESFKENTESVISQLETKNQALEERNVELHSSIEKERGKVENLMLEFSQEKKRFSSEIERSNDTHRKMLVEVDTARQEAKLSAKKFAEKCNELAAVMEQVKNLKQTNQTLEIANQMLKLEQENHIERIDELRVLLQERDRQFAQERAHPAPTQRRLKMSIAASIKSTKRLKR